VDTSADDVNTMVNDQPIVLPEQGQEMREHTPRPQPPAPAPRPQTMEPRPRPRIPETNPLSGKDRLGLVIPRKPHPAVTTLREAEAAGISLDVDVDQQLLIDSAGSDNLPDVPFSDVPLPDVSLPNVPLPDVPLPEARLDSSLGEEWTCPCVADKASVVAFRLWLGSYLVHFLYSNLFISGIHYYKRREVFGLLKVYFIYGFCTGYIFIGFHLFIVLWDIPHVEFLQLLACKEPSCDGFEAQ